MEKVVAKIAVRQVELSKLVTNLEQVSNNVHIMFIKQCDSTTYTKDIRERMDQLEAYLQYSTNALTIDASYSVVHLSKVNFQEVRLT